MRGWSTHRHCLSLGSCWSRKTRLGVQQCQAQQLVFCICSWLGLIQNRIRMFENKWGILTEGHLTYLYCTGCLGNFGIRNELLLWILRFQWALCDQKIGHKWDILQLSCNSWKCEFAWIWKEKILWSYFSSDMAIFHQILLRIPQNDRPQKNGILQKAIRLDMYVSLLGPKNSM